MSVFNVALSGLRAATGDLQVTGNNISNANTYGFKQSRTEFADVFVSGVGGNQTGNGVRISGVSQDFNQGSVSITGNSLDMAINGDSFFILNGANGGEIKYTRAGNFEPDREGYIISKSTGDRLQGYQAVDGALTASVGDLQISSEPMQPKMTSQIKFDYNLDASSEIPALAFDPTDKTSFNNRTSVEIFDSLGSSHNMSTYYVKTAGNNWDVHVEMDGTMVTNGTLSFTDAGAFSASTGLDPITWTPGGGAQPNQQISMNYNNTTQYGSAMAVRGQEQDGFSTGYLTGIDVDKDGVISARYTNSQVQPMGQVALAKFNNPQGLFAMGDMAYAETRSSGSALVGADNSTGAIQSGALEESNVNLTEQLVKLITAQRNFQANSQAIKAGDVVTQTIINIQ